MKRDQLNKIRQTKNHRGYDRARIINGRQTETYRGYNKSRFNDGRWTKNYWGNKSLRGAPKNRDKQKMKKVAIKK